MKKKIIIIICLAILLLIFLYFRCIYGWYEFKFYKETPREYISNTIVTKKDYSTDSTAIVHQIKGFVKNHQESFYSEENDGSTQIILDTILYSPDHKKIAAFIISKNSTTKQLMPDKKNKWYYNATCYLGTKQQNSLILSWIGPNYTSNDVESISKRIRNYYLKQKSSNTQNNKDNYNIDDIRYWSKSIDWENLEHNRKMQKDFEEEKLRNPENVYDPNDKK
ncbi:hypothetical protein CEY12_12440 [Chryseobacterium sp. T16E-39]|uniref:hypothetical protein n=1 Tax=Chryseobacterium sp. T16E-39 TaxID=2015076 RepID=UPI000B5B3D46|nr:hypothetical protein [Chryseobacterium sp. T16E-39]ASK30872.1 hypothetical protein CEY12_12440 [Chryseobacterium sp. T16E-39]